MQTEAERLEAYHNALNLMNVMEIEFGADFEYTEGDHNWTVERAAPSVLYFLIENARESEVICKVIDGKLIVG